MKISLDELKEFLIYIPETGKFIRRISTGYRGIYKEGTQAGSESSVTGYVQICINGKTEYAHRLAWLYMTGLQPEDAIDHINGKRSDNRWNNLREANKKINGRNMKLISTNKTGYCGVSFEKQTKKYRARIYVDGKTINLGRFENLHDAVRVRRAAEKEHGFHENHGQR